MSGTGCDRRERRQEVLSGADLVGRGEDHEDDLGNGAGTRNQASHSAWALFSCQKFLAFSFVFDKYCPIME